MWTKSFVGGKQDDMTHIFGILPSKVHCIFCWFLQAVNAATEFDIGLPQVFKEWDKVGVGFKKKSYCQLFHGCYDGLIDGFFHPTTCPTI